MGEKSDSTKKGGVGQGPKAHIMGKKSKTAHLHLTFALPGTQINDLKTENSGPLLDPEKIAECLNIHFTNVGAKLASEIPMVECDVNSVDSRQNSV